MKSQHSRHAAGNRSDGHQQRQAVRLLDLLDEQQQRAKEAIVRIGSPRWIEQPQIGLHRAADRIRLIETIRPLLGKWRGMSSHAEDRVHQIRTERLITPKGHTVGEDAHLYVPLAYGQARRVLRRLQLHRDDVVVDLGCGLGRVVALAARREVSKVVGVEFDMEMATLARQNIRSMRGRRSPAEIVTMDAAHANLDGVTVVILFNPFGPETMKSVLGNLFTSIERQPRRVRLAYVNPTAEREFEETGWLTRVSTLRSARYRHTVSFWSVEGSADELKQGGS